MSEYYIHDDEQTEFDLRHAVPSLHHEQFEEIQYEKNYLNCMIKIAEPINPEGDTICVENDGLIVAKVENQSNITKGYEFNRVFRSQEKPSEIYQYIQYYSDCVLDGEDCNVIGYGGRKTNKSKILYGNVNQLDGLVYNYLLDIFEKIQYRNIDGRLTMSLSVIDLKDNIYDSFTKDKPTPFSLKISKEKYTQGSRKEYIAEILNINNLTRVLIDDPAGSVNFIQQRIKSNLYSSGVGSIYLSIYFDGEDNIRITSGRMNFIEILNSEWLSRSQIVKNPFHTLLENLVNKEIVNYALTNLTYLLRDNLCKGVRTTLIGFISPLVNYLSKTIDTIATVGLIYNKDKGNLVDLGIPLQRQIYKFHEIDRYSLEKLLNQMKAENQFLFEEIENLVESDASIHKSKMINMKTEIDIAKSLWDNEANRINNDKIAMIEKQRNCKKLQLEKYNSRLDLLKQYDIVLKQDLDLLDDVDVMNLELQPDKEEVDKLNEQLIPIRIQYNDLINKNNNMTNEIEQLKTEITKIESELNNNNKNKKSTTTTIKTTTRR